MDNLPDTPNESTTIESSSKSEEDDELDPRVQIELERLNHANEAINHLELQLDEARKTLKELLNAAEADLSELEKKIGSAVSKARSYYDTRIQLRDAKEKLTKAKHRFERAQALQVAAKELAFASADQIEEAKVSNQNTATWNETYSHAIAQAADAEREKYLADLEQQRAEGIYSELEKRLEQLQKDFRRSINKSKPYYEMKADYHKELDFQKRKVYGLENCVNEAKSEYQQSLRNLERISNEIHEQRNRGKSRKELGERTSGVGEEQSTQIETKPRNNSNDIRRPSLIQTEPLSTEIFTTTNHRYSPEGVETTPTNINDQFILCSRQTSHVTLINNSEHESDNNRERLSSCSSQLSQLTNDSDKAGSLHVLSDEQLDYLTYEYRPYSSELSYESDPIDDIISTLHQSNLQAKEFFRNLFKPNSIKN